MKKLTAGIITSVLVVTLAGSTAFALGRYGQTDTGSSDSPAGQQTVICRSCGECGHHFADEDGDGICDYFHASDRDSGCRRQGLHHGMSSRGTGCHRNL